MAEEFPYRNLVMQGGGVKTFGYHGALNVLEETGILDGLTRVAGTSAGASTALLLSFKLPLSETLGILRTLDSQKMMQLASQPEGSFKPPKVLESQFRAVSEYMEAASRLTRHYGWYSNAYLYTWLQEIIAAQCQGNGMATFADFRSLGFRDLYTIAVNLNTHQYQIFSVETTPDVAVADAVLMSTALPFFFEPVLFDGRAIGQGDIYVDGGVLYNYPLHIFDQERYVEHRKHFVQGINWETLGFYLSTPPETTHRRREITNLLGYFQNLIEALIEGQTIPFEMDPIDRARSIAINDHGITPVDFHIQPLPEDEMYQRMVADGTAAMRKFLEEKAAIADQGDWLAALGEAVDRMRKTIFGG